MMEEFRFRQSIRVSAILLMVFGSWLTLSDIIGRSVFFYYHSVSDASFGIWSGAFFLLTGLHGLLAASYYNRTTRCYLIAYHVLSIASACLALSLFITLGMIGGIQYDEWLRSTYSHDFANYGNSVISIMQTIIFGFVTIIAVVASVVSGKNVCCCYNGPAIVNVIGYHGIAPETQSVSVEVNGVTVRVPTENAQPFLSGRLVANF